MNAALNIFTLCLSLILIGTLTQASSGKGQKPRSTAYNLPGHDPIGKPGDNASITRTIEISIKETENGYLLFEPDAIHIEKDSVVRFVVNNPGDLDHDFFLGSFNEIAEHKQWMREHPDMQHDGLNAVSISSGQSDELAWQFSAATNLEFACLRPAHREAGMWGVIMVHERLASNSNG
ncbi:cupredoxin domain-containing protein [Sulfitobacter sp. BSw21498]|uniref:cupredoxin domain-containing protein n=1 Tax=Sulfitobacter sp. BSw21498 TaxID=664426 RepID=UPI0011105F30|nr:plastocyanin/azurin family copper-binding protein [Sulfitobacter sp. BSw21498]